MKKILSAACFLATLVAGSAQAATIFPNGTAVVDTTQSTLVSVGPTTYFGITLMDGGNGLNFFLQDTNDDGNSVSYALYQDTDLGVGFSAGSLIGSAFTLQEGQSLLFSGLASGGQYVLRTILNGATAYSASTHISAVPLPGAALLFGSALLGAGALRRRQKQQAE